MLGRTPIKWRQHTDMVIAIDWDAESEMNQRNKQKKKKNAELSAKFREMLISEIILNH